MADTDTASSAPSTSATAATTGASWTCQVPTAPKEEKGFTVGEVFELKCEGLPVELKEPLKVKLPEKQEHALALLHPISLTSTEIRYNAASYRVGQHTLNEIELVDSDGKTLKLNPVQIKVASVIQPPPPEQPYGPISPLPLSWPLWIFGVLGAIAVVLVLWVIFVLRRRLQRQALEKNIKKFLSPMGSYHQFNKDMRLLKRGVVFSSMEAWPESQVQHYIQQLDEIFRMFVLREYIVPATTWPVAAVARDIRKKEKHNFAKFRDPFFRAFKELDRAKGNPAGFTARDCEQLTTICFQAVDAMWKSKLRGAR